jgi:DNA end-binding protein Ku
VLTKEDFKAAAVEKTRTIDDRFFETPYYLVPSKGGERAYALLREAIRESDRIGIATFIQRDAQHLAAVEVIDHAIVLSVLRFVDELADPKPLGFPTSDGIRKAELDMAKALVDNLLRIIKGKVKGKTVTLEPTAEPRQAEVVDLMERLRRSLDHSGARRRATKTRATKKAAAKKRTRRAA